MYIINLYNQDWNVLCANEKFVMKLGILEHCVLTLQNNATQI